jgi:probable DNA repair protein
LGGGKLTSYRECFEQAVSELAAGATVLTTNTRSARALRAATESRLHASNAAWLTPDVLPYEAFVERLYSDALVMGEVGLQALQREQELLLWRQIIERSPSGREMLLPESAAALAAESFRTAMEYGIALDSPQMSASSDTRAFSGWAAEFRRHLAAHGWTCQALLARELAPCLARLGLPRHLFVFLSATTPAQRSFLDALAAAGVRVDVSREHAEAAVAPARYELDGVADELRTAAQWARQQVEALPDARIGVIFFDLERKRTDVENTFRAVLHPEHLLSHPAPAAFEIASPLALADYPVVRCALQLLSLLAAPLDFHSFTALLSSPYLADSPESVAAFLAGVRKHAQREVSFEELTKWLHESKQLPGLRAAVQPLPKHSSFSSEQAPAYWADVSRRILETFGWPGNVALNSEEFQCTERWRDLLVSGASLELLEWRVDFRGYVSWLVRAASTQNFKPETLHAPVQIMDADEAEGSVFDALWIGSCSDDFWPDSPKPSPLLPIALLKEAGVALAGTPQAEARISRISSRLLQSAPQVSLSMARRTDDEREQRWSPCFAGFALAEETIKLPVPLVLRFEPADMDVVADAIAPALRSGEIARGGTSLLAEQSNCPFRAFAIRRLLAREAEGPNEALAPTERGKVVDRALQLIWAELKDSAGLLRADRAAVVERCVEDAMAGSLPPSSDAWTTRFRRLERQRTIEVLTEWLEFESKRKPFHVIGHQREVDVELGGLTLHGCLDRLDEIDDAHVVIDYKTGAVNSVTVWQVPRPRMPQLPFYALAMQRQKLNLAGVSFAYVRKGEPAFKGFLRDKDLLPSTAPRKNAFEGLGFDEYTARWAEELERIASAFVQGDAAVDPKTPPGRNNSPCEHCHLMSLCRVGEPADDASEMETTGGEDE